MSWHSVSSLISVPGRSFGSILIPFRQEERHVRLVTFCSVTPREYRRPEDEQMQSVQSALEEQADILPI